MRNKSLHSIFTLMQIVLLAAAASCTLPVKQEAPSMQGAIEIVFPEDGAQLSDGEMVDIQSVLIDPGGLTSVILLVNDEETRNDDFSGSMIEGNLYQPWIPPGPGTYVLKIKIGSGSMVESNPITVFVGEKPAEPVAVSEEAPVPGKDTPTGTQTATLTMTPTITTTTTPDIPTATGKQNANCRKGPGHVYPILDAVREGETTPIVGRNAAGTWLVVEMVRGSGTCYVFGDLVETSGNLNDLTVFKDPSTPVPTKTNTNVPPSTPYAACHDYPDIGTCNADPNGFGGCSWNTGLNKCQP